MNEVEIMKDPEIASILFKLEEVNKAKELAGYNLFTVSSYTSNLENFHSDIIKTLLDPKGLHGEAYSYLHLFISYLNDKWELGLEKSNYSNVIVDREKGRIDVWVKDEKSKHCIIIENKINNAPDMPDQLLNYYSHAKAYGYFPDVIVYLSLDGKKTAPFHNADVNKLVVNIPAYNQSSHELYSGWLRPCFQESTNDDSRSFLYQYCKLITHLSNSNMDNDIKEQLYQFISQQEKFESILNLIKMFNSFSDYRATKFSDQVKDILPFKKKFPYYNNYWIFERYDDVNDSYKLDVFFLQDGSAKVVMWNTAKRENGGYETVVEKLKSINLLDDFNSKSMYNGLAAEFTISEKMPKISDVDNAVVNLVNKVLEGLRALEAKK